jgi:phage terminase large subunit GpA-like protein
VKLRFKFEDSERSVFKRKPDIPVSSWAVQNIIVQDGPYRGAPFRLDVAPYLLDIINSYSKDSVEEVIVCGAPQTGKTLAMYICLGYSMERRTGTKMITMPDDKNVARVEAEKLKPLIRASPLLHSLVSKMTAGHIKLKDGSSLFLSSAQAPAQRASITVRDLFMDEEDLYLTVAGRGDPVNDFLERTRSYFIGRKIMRVSKPVGDSQSSIWNALISRSHVCYSYEVCCPKCGGAQFFKESNVVTIEAGGEEKNFNSIIRLSLGRYRCAHCDVLWTDYDKNLAVSEGKWVPSKVTELNETGEPSFELAEAPSKAKTLGFHLPAILSRAVSLSELAARIREAEASENIEVKQMQANGHWARPYIPVVLKPLELDILKRRDFSLEARKIPRGAVALSCGIDTQKVGFYYLVLAWMPNFTKYIVDYGRLASFDDVTKLVWETSYPVLGDNGSESDERMEIWRAAIDTGGTLTEGVYTRTEEVYEYVRMEGYDRLFAIKGALREQTPTIKWTTLDRLPGRQTPILGGLLLYLIDTGNIKSSMFAALLNQDSKRPIKLYGLDPEATDQDSIHKGLIKHLTAERQIRQSDGRLVWIQEHRDNHWLDCLMMAMACGDVSWTPSLHHLIMQLREEEREEAAQSFAPPIRPQKQPKPRRSGW